MSGILVILLFLATQNLKIESFNLCDNQNTSFSYLLFCDKARNSRCHLKGVVTQRIS